MSAEAPPGEAEAVGHDALIEELEADVRRLRASGEVPASLERQLDEAIARLVQHRHRDHDLTQAILEVDAAAHALEDWGAVVAGGLVRRQVKQVINRAMAWYMKRVASFSFATSSVLGALSDRLEGLREELVSIRTPLPHGARGGGVPATPSLLDTEARWSALALERFSGARGRVLHAECGRGALVAAFGRAGVDCYGVDPHGRLLDEPAAASLDLVHADALEHIRDVPPESLGGLILSGCVERLAVPEARTLAYLVGSRLSPGSSIMVVSTHPSSWERRADPVEADLAPGRPLHAETWRFLLAEQGFGSIEIQEDDGVSPHAQPLPGSDDLVLALNTQLAQLWHALAPGGTYAVLGALAR